MAKKEEKPSVYKLDKDTFQVLHQIVHDLRYEKELKNKWNLPVKDDYWYNINFHGDQMELRVECLKGGFRSSRVDSLELQRLAGETKKLFDKFEKMVRSEFKDRAGKSLVWGRGNQYCNYEKVAMNNLYKFYCVKNGPVRVNLGGQEFSEDGPELNKGDIREDDYMIVDTSKIENWR